MESGTIKDKPRNPHVTVALVGLVDSGKSTLLGSLLHQTGHFTIKEFARAKQLSEDYGRPSFLHANLVTKIREERERAVTIGARYFYRTIGTVDYTFIDTPGHRDFFKSTLGGITQADVVILVCPPKYVFEVLPLHQSESFLKLLQVIVFRRPQKLIFAINGLDDLHPHALSSPSSDYESIYTKCKEYIGQRLAALGEPGLDTAFVPVAPRLEQTNLLRGEPRAFAWHGPSLQDELESTAPAVRSFDLPLKLVCCYDCKVSGVGWVLVAALEAGVLTVGCPFRVVGLSYAAFVVKGIHYMGRPVHQAFPGDLVAINFVEHRFDSSRYRYRFSNVRGMVLEDLREPETGVVVGLTVRLKVLATPGEFKKGWRPLLYAHRDRFGCELLSFTDITPAVVQTNPKGDSTTGSAAHPHNNNNENNNNRLQRGGTYLATFGVSRHSRPVVLHEYSTFGSAFGKVFVEEANKIVAVGVVERVFREVGELKAAV